MGVSSGEVWLANEHAIIVHHCINFQKGGDIEVEVKVDGMGLLSRLDYCPGQLTELL